MILTNQGRRIDQTLTKAGSKVTSALFCSKATEAFTTPFMLMRADSTEFEQAAHVIPVTLTWILLKFPDICSKFSSSKEPSNLSSSPVSIATDEPFAVSCRFLILSVSLNPYSAARSIYQCNDKLKRVRVIFYALTIFWSRAMRIWRLNTKGEWGTGGRMKFAL